MKYNDYKSFKKIYSLENFDYFKEGYTFAREVERQKIIDYLVSTEKYTNVKGIDYKELRNQYAGGKGKTNYGKRKKSALNPAYNLNNWKYIETRYRDNIIFISLQSFDVDPTSHNLHVLMDRIGFFVCPISIYKSSDLYIKDPFSGKDIYIKDSLLRMEITEFELPMREQDIINLLKYIENRIDETVMT